MSAELRGGVGSVDLDHIRAEVDELITRLDVEVRAIQGTESPIELFDRLRRIDDRFAAVRLEWAELRGSIGVAAARELVRKADLFGGWQNHWGNLVERAWHRRSELERLSVESPVLERNRLVHGRLEDSVDSQGDSRSAGQNTVLVLDLRYAVSLPLARIGEYLGMSNSGVQLRISDFEDGILVEIGRETVEQQLPQGWRLESPAYQSERSPRLLLRRAIDHGGPRAIALTILPVWEDREVSVGRPRSLVSSRFARNSRLTRQIWAPVFSGGPRVVYVPDSLLGRGHEPGDVSGSAVIEAARANGLAVLNDAINAVLAPSAEGNSTLG